MTAMLILVIFSGLLAIACAWADSKPAETETPAEPCPVVVLDAHRAARKPGSNVAVIRGGRS